LCEPKKNGDPSKDMVAAPRLKMNEILYLFNKLTSGKESIPGDFGRRGKEHATH
jgi:hypothetical protein